MSEYKDFKIIIAQNGADNYAVRIEKNDQIGEAVSIFSKQEIVSLADYYTGLKANLRKMKVIADTEEAADTINYIEPLKEDAAKIFGINLSKLIFRDEISVRLGEFKNYCRQQNAVLRIRLDLSLAPELAVLPWEYLRKTDNSNFVCLDDEITLVRYLQTAVPVRSLKVNSGLRVLIISSMPTTAGQLDINAEIKEIKKAIIKEADNLPNNIRAEVLTEATPKKLKEQLETALMNDDPFHVLHFIGHGEFNDSKKEGELLFQDENQKSLPYNNEDFARLLQKFNSDLRLVVLNACEGARSSVIDSYSSVATKIMQTAEIPAVIAMQFSITDTAAIIFAKYFYSELSKGENLEKSVDTARKAINEEQEYRALGKQISEGKEWATPVLYLRTDDGCLFDIRLPRPPQELINLGHYNDIANLLSNNNLVVFIGLDVNLSNRPSYDSWKPGKGLPSTAEVCSYLNNTLKVSPPINSLAGLAKKLQLKNFKLAAAFSPIFEAANNTSKLYEVLSEITNRLMPKNPIPATNPWICPIIFVTTTYDCALEKAFDNAGISYYNVFCYTKTAAGEWLFNHRQYENGAELKDLRRNLTNANQYLIENNFPIILKLPGEVADKSGFAITEDDFFAFSSKGIHALLPPDLLTQIANSPHLYLGYDFQNWTLRMMWDRLCYNRNAETNKDSYALIFDEEKDPNAQFWKDKNIAFAIADLDDYVIGLEKCVLPNLNGE